MDVMVWGNQVKCIKEMTESSSLNQAGQIKRAQPNSLNHAGSINSAIRSYRGIWRVESNDAHREMGTAPYASRFHNTPETARLNDLGQ
jgi:hypothetical protein